MNVPIVAGDIDDDAYKPRFVRVSIDRRFCRFFVRPLRDACRMRSVGMLMVGIGTIAE